MNNCSANLTRSTNLYSKVERLVSMAIASRMHYYDFLLTFRAVEAPEEDLLEFQVTSAQLLHDSLKDSAQPDLFLLSHLDAALAPVRALEKQLRVSKVKMGEWVPCRRVRRLLHAEPCRVGNPYARIRS